MNPRGRFLSALRGKQPDRVPIFETVINEPIIRKLVQLLDVRPTLANESGISNKNISQINEERGYLELYCNVLEKLDIDAICYSFSSGRKRISESKIKDKYGRIYNLSPHGEPLVATALVRNLSDAVDLNMASKLDLEDFSDLQKIVARFGGHRACCMGFADPFKESWCLMGKMENFLLSFRENPTLVHKLLRVTTDFLIKAIDLAVDVGIDAFIMAGDLAHETGLLFSLKDYRNYFKPYHKEIIEHVHQKGKLIVKHSDGNVWELLDDWMELGFDGIHPIQPQCMDIRKVKGYLDGKMSILGNIDCRNLLVFGSEEQVRETVKKTIEEVASGGGYIISSSNTIHPGCKAENYIAMVRATHRYGIY